MEVRVAVFPETRVAAIEHRGPPDAEHRTVRRLVAWKLERGLVDPLRNRHYGVHYTDPTATPPELHRVDFCLSVDEPVGPNADGIVDRVIPSTRCALARDVGSRSNNAAAAYLGRVWLPQSGETAGDFPIFFHYVNVGPHVREEDAITDVYLPLK